jgi:hypothetical protein
MERSRKQAAQRKKAAEAHEKRELEYLRSAGVKLDEIEKGLNEDARNLKSLLDEIRPPLISRPSKRAADSQQTANQAAHLAGLGQLIPPLAGFYYPPDTSGEVLPTDPSRIKIKDSFSGQGWGWMGLAGKDVPPADVVFTFVPDQDGTYSLTASFAFHGFYVAKADDGAFTSKHASVSLDFSLDTFQFVDRSQKLFPLIDVGGQNIDIEFDNFDHVLTFTDTQNLRQGEPVVVTAQISVSASASGGGSYAEINFEDGDANYIEPQYLWVTNLAGFGH